MKKKFTLISLVFASLITNTAFGSSASGIPEVENVKEPVKGLKSRIELPIKRDAEPFYVMDQVELDRAAQTLLKYISSIEFEGKEEVIENLSVQIIENNISLQSIDRAITAMLASQSLNISEEEKSAFKGLPEYGFLKTFPVENPKLDGVFLFSTALPNVQWVDSAGLSEGLRVKLEDFLMKSLDVEKIILTLGVSFFNFHDIVESMIFKRFLVSLPKLGQKLSGHGIRMSPLSFFMHDVLHSRLDGRTSDLKSYANKLLSYLINEREMEVDRFISLVVNRVIDQDRLMTRVFHEILQEMDNHKDEIGEKQYKKALYGFFRFAHEHGFSLNYDAMTLENILLQNRADYSDPKDMTEQDLIKLYQLRYIEGSETDEVIINRSRERLLGSGELSIEKAQINREREGVEVILHLNNREVITYSYQDLGIAYQLLKDDIKGLRFFGEFPELQGNPEGSIDLLKRILRIQFEIQDARNSFGRMVRDFSNNEDNRVKILYETEALRIKNHFDAQVGFILGRETSLPSSAAGIDEGV